MFISAPRVTIERVGPPVLDGDDLTSYAFADTPFGDAHERRQVIVLVKAYSLAGFDRTLNSASIGGVEAEIDVQAVANNHPSAALDECGLVALVRARVPAGETGAVNLTFSGQMANVVVTPYRMIGGVLHDTATSARGQEQSGFEVSAGTTRQVTIETPVNGAGIAFASAVTAATSGAISGSSWTGFTEDLDSPDLPPSGDSRFTAALTSTKGEATPQVTWAGSSLITVTLAMLAASYRP